MTPPRVAWDRAALVRGAVLGAPAAVVAAGDVRLGAVLAVGLVPATAVPLPPRRRDRARVALLGSLVAASLVLGGLLARWPPAAVVGILVLAVGAARLASVRPRLSLVLYLCLPLTAVGFSFPGLATVGRLAAVMVAGSVWAALVGLAWPAGPDRPDPPSPPAGTTDRGLVGFGLRAGLAGAVCTAIGFAADLEHVGWAPTAALLVMRPSPRLQATRSWNRVADVVLGAALAVATVTLDVPAPVVALLVLATVMTMTAVAGSGWYLTPLFTTFLVLLLLLAGDVDDATTRFRERVGETLLGVGVAAIVSVSARALSRRGS
ncbi:FUSC family protein [Nocardioides lianchengensis]|uniref:Fusaric acid resistance protein-like n=1 Tax=Nocardioides lianchengensis TaxID=1045774 RepID=A0A1G6W283_9ACTN|nr:FUSC family protein [Nocardioides lianchengensis]NYG09468.1 hypothetical protein [Nocardioides lianchengensis]SDD59898.1 Fusaric acid resistance protein-like [Nocardioides lianchengensis]